MDDLYAEGDLTVLPDETDRAIEALVMVAEEPVEAQLLAQLLEIPRAEVERRCAALARQYEASNRGFELVQVAGGYRFQTHPDLAPYIERYVLDGQSAKMSAAAMETLAIVAYKQPISRAQIAAIRGVNADGVMRTLQQRGYVAEIARDPGPGQAALYGTTRLFLERVGLDSLDGLAPLGDFVPGSDVLEALETVLVADGDPRRRSRNGGAEHGGAEQEGDEAHQVQEADDALRTEAPDDTGCTTHGANGAGTVIDLRGLFGEE